MFGVLHRMGRNLCVAVGLIGSTAFAQTPAISLEVVSVNSKALQQSAGTITVGPGDVLTLEILARDWSPNGELLRAMQAAIDPRGYTSGHSGNVNPVDFDETSAKQKENKKNGYIDTSHPRYVYGDKRPIAIVDTISPGYRYMNVVIARDEARLCPTRDGTRYYCGTLKLRVSDDALGPFKVGFIVDGGSTVLRDPENKEIGPLRVDPVTINVVRDVVPLRIVSSNPPDGAIDARLPATEKNPAGGWDTVTLKFNGDTSTLKPRDFTIDDGTPKPPRVKELSADGSVLTLRLDRGIGSRRWTRFTHNASSTGIRLGHLTGDVNNDGAVNLEDLFALMPDPTRTGRLLPYQADIDCDGNAGLTDLLRLIDVLNRPDAHRSTLPNP